MGDYQKRGVITRKGVISRKGLHGNLARNGIRIMFFKQFEAPIDTYW